MAADKAAGLQSDAIGKQQHCQQDEANQDQERLESEAPIAAKEGNDFGQRTDNHQVNSGQDEGQRILQDRMGWVNVKIKMADAEERAQDQTARQQQGDGVDGLEWNKYATEQERLGAGIGAGNKQHAQPKNHKFD